MWIPEQDSSFLSREYKKLCWFSLKWREEALR